MNQQRFKQLYQLAYGGDMEAKADLWLEFKFAFDHDPLPAFMQEPSLGGACCPSAPSGGAPASVTKCTAGVSPATSNPNPQTTHEVRLELGESSEAANRTPEGGA